MFMRLLSKYVSCYFRDTIDFTAKHLTRFICAATAEAAQINLKFSCLLIIIMR